MTKMVKELKRDMLDKVAGGAYNIDETIPGVQEFIQECLRQRQIGLSEGIKITNQLTQDKLQRKLYKITRIKRDVNEQIKRIGVYYMCIADLLN